jgi:hypothetical protein
MAEAGLVLERRRVAEDDGHGRAGTVPARERGA